MDLESFKALENSPLGQSSAISSFGNLQLIKGLSFFYNDTETNHPILEIGGGIGTITKTLLENYQCDIYCYEMNEFCLKMLAELQNQGNNSERLNVSSDLSEWLEINFSAVIIDGPISRKQMRGIINKSSELKFILVENYRLLSRLHISIELFKSRYRQQYLEVRHNFKPVAAVFFVEKTSNSAISVHRCVDVLFTFLRIFPKLVLHIFLSRGKILKVGKVKEDGYGILKS